jgi:hypothetical protein
MDEIEMAYPAVLDALRGFAARHPWPAPLWTNRAIVRYARSCEIRAGAAEVRRNRRSPRVMHKTPRPLLQARRPHVLEIFGAALGVVAALLACVDNSMPARDVVKIRASREFGCPQHAVRVRDLGGRVFQVAACGESRKYVCNRDETDSDGSLNSITCVEEGAGLPPDEPEGPAYVPVVVGH